MTINSNSVMLSQVSGVTDWK